MSVVNLLWMMIVTEYVLWRPKNRVTRFVHNAVTGWEA